MRRNKVRIKPPDFYGVMNSIIGSIQSEAISTGDKASLRRMDISSPNNAAFWRMMRLTSKKAMPRNFDEGAIQRWGLIMQGIAIMSHSSGVAHNAKNKIGSVLYQGNGNNQPFYSEQRLATLLSAKEEALHQILSRLFRMVAREGCSFNWYDMASLILDDGYEEQKAEEAKIEIARFYYTSEYNYNKN